MTTAASSIRISVRNADQVAADLALLSESANASAQLRQRLFDLGDLSAHIRCVYLKDLPAVSAGEFICDLEFSDALAGALSAVRAGEFNA